MLKIAYVVDFKKYSFYPIELTSNILEKFKHAFDFWFDFFGLTI